MVGVAKLHIYILYEVMFNRKTPMFLTYIPLSLLTTSVIDGKKHENKY